MAHLQFILISDDDESAVNYEIDEHSANELHAVMKKVPGLMPFEAISNITAALLQIREAVHLAEAAL